MSSPLQSALIHGERAGGRYVVASPTTFQRGLSGVRHGNSAGSSLEFLDHREYQPGDDIRHINWNAMARSDRLTVKLFREEISPHLDLILDGSRSMDLEDSEKGRATIGLAALLAQAAANAGFTCKPWIIRAGCQPIPDGHLAPSSWKGIDFDFVGNGAESLARMPPRLRPLGLRILLSDLLWEGDPGAVVRMLSYQATRVMVVQILAEADRNPVMAGNIRLIDAETREAQEIFADEAALRAYHANLARLQQEWQMACRRLGASMTTMIAETFVQKWEPVELLIAQILSVQGAA